MTNDDLSGQTALVTGATRGIGRAIAAALARRGARVIGTATTEAGAQAVSAALAELGGGGGAGVCLDVTDADGVERTVEQVVRDHGGLHILVNNAGITRDTLVMRMKDADWDAVLDTNLKAVFRLCRAAVRPMLKQRHGRIVTVTSIVGGNGNAGQANYAAAKAGATGLSRSLAREVAGRGITVNCVAPGFITTDMTDALPTALRDALLAQIPAGRLGSCDDVAHAVAFLASRGAGYITGIELAVNGGLRMD